MFGFEEDFPGWAALPASYIEEAPRANRGAMGFKPHVGRALGIGGFERRAGRFPSKALGYCEPGSLPSEDVERLMDDALR